MHLYWCACLTSRNSYVPFQRPNAPIIGQRGLNSLSYFMRISIDLHGKDRGLGQRAPFAN